MIFLDTVNIELPKALGSGGHPQFPFNLELFKDGLCLQFNNPVTIFAGENGSGKSTLLESLAVACGFPRQGGTTANTIRKTYGTNAIGEEIVIENDNLELSNHMKLSWRMKTKRGYFFRAEYMTDTLSKHFFSNKYLSCSHGEGILEVARDFFRDGLFILDEPETALSPTSQLALLSLIYENAKKYNAQYIIVTHSPILMGIPDADFRWIAQGQFAPMDYIECPHFQITKTFCDNPQRLLKELQ